MASLGSSTRSAARATFSAYRRLPIRWRLAGGSAALTFVILAGFAAIVGVLTSRQVRGQFNNEVSFAADNLEGELGLRFDANVLQLDCNRSVHLGDYASAEHAQIRIYDVGTGDLLCTQDQVVARGTKVPSSVKPKFPMPRRVGTYTKFGYRVVAREVTADPIGNLILLYARPLSDVDHTLGRVQLFLLLGVLGGTFLALLAGLANAQRAMRPIAQLTDAAREIERTRDPSGRLPQPQADDEVAELARTLEGMLAALDAERSTAEGLLQRQREFIADASHELRTPLTSVLANLELLAEELDGDQADTAQAALRSTRRMRRLVGDLLLLARADARRGQPHRRTDLAEVLTDVAAELGPVTDDHELSINAGPAAVYGVRDDLHRLALNLIENAVGHTPPGTKVRASTATSNGSVTLTVEDNGQGIAPELRERLFERFVRGGNPNPPTRGSGLGLAIVRAVAEAHGGTVVYETRSEGQRRGTKFVIEIPRAPDPPPPADQEPELGLGAQTSTTTGSTIGRRRSRS
jgi:two-component system OmpR family sensor kinase